MTSIKVNNEWSIALLEGVPHHLFHSKCGGSMSNNHLANFQEEGLRCNCCKRKPPEGTKAAARLLGLKFLF